MSRLRFNRRATRCRKLTRHLGITAVLTVASVAVGVPVVTGPLEALGLVDADGPDAEAATTKPGAGPEASESHASIVKFRRGVVEVREQPARPEPAPTPTPEATEEPVEEPVEEPAEEPAPVAPAGSIEDIIASAAAEFGLDPGYLIGVASCESGLDPGAYNEAGYHGLFQFDEQTWAAYGYGDIFDPTAQSRSAARLIASGEGSRWPNCA